MSTTGIRKNSLTRTLEKLLPLFFLVFVFFLYFSLLSGPFFTDEQDVLLGGYELGKGKELYRYFQSQHMPFSYYMAIPVAMLGARTVFQYRLGMYVMMALLWEIIYLRHRKAFHPVSLFAMPLLYLAFLKNIYLGTTMISDHWQGIGLVMIMLELIRYAKSKEIALPCAVMVSLGIMLSFGTVFTAAYPAFCYFLAVAALQIVFLRQARKEGPEARKQLGRRMLREDLRLVGICLAPFLILVVWYALTGNLANAWEGAYQINIDYYSLYANGLGSDPVGLVWDTWAMWGHYLLQAVQTLGQTPGVSLSILLQTVCLIVFCVLCGRKSPAVGIGIFAAAVFCGTRDFHIFHSMAYYAHTAAAMALLIGMALEKCDGHQILRWVSRGAVAVAALLVLADFGYWGAYNLLYPQLLGRPTARAEERMVDLLTEPEEVVFSCDAPIFCEIVMDLELMPASACDVVSIRWYYDLWKDRVLASLREEPHIVLYKPDEAIWGYTFHDYAIEFEDYLLAHYTRLPMGENVWVSNDFLPEALERLKAAGYGDRLVLTSTAEEVHTREFVAGESVTQSFVAEGEQLNAVAIRAACYYGRRRPTLSLRVLDHESGQMVGEAVMSPDLVADNFFSRCPLQATLTPGKTYNLVLTVEKIDGRGNLGLYFDDEDHLPLGLEYLE